jgi:hypothetical protein
MDLTLRWVLVPWRMTIRKRGWIHSLLWCQGRRCCELSSVLYMGMYERFEAPSQPLGRDEQRNKTVLLFWRSIWCFWYMWCIHEVHVTSAKYRLMLASRLEKFFIFCIVFVQALPWTLWCSCDLPRAGIVSKYYLDNCSGKPMWYSLSEGGEWGVLCFLCVLNFLQ